MGKKKIEEEENVNSIMWEERVAVKLLPLAGRERTYSGCTYCQVCVRGKMKKRKRKTNILRTEGMNK